MLLCLCNHGMHEHSNDILLIMILCFNNNGNELLHSDVSTTCYYVSMSTQGMNANLLCHSYSLPNLLGNELLHSDVSAHATMPQ